MQIVYAYYDSPGPRDTGTNKSLNGEWIKIKNKGSKPVSLKGWKLRDKQGFTYKFGKYTLGAGKSVKIHTGKGSDTRKDRYWDKSWYVWNNTSDKAILKNSKGTTVDTCKWTTSDPGYKAC